MKDLIREMRSRGWKVFTRPGELNIVGVRHPSIIPNTFNDHIHVFYTDQGAWKRHAFPATTDPGAYWLRNPIMPQGTALLVEQQALDAYAIANHRGLYPALCQRHKAVRIVRDHNRNTRLDFTARRSYKGFFGINIHRANKTGTTRTVERHSAGCQVFANANHFEAFMALCHRHRRLYGNTFTYSLIDLRALKKRKRRRVLKWTGAALLATLGAITLKSTWQNE